MQGLHVHSLYIYVFKKQDKVRALKLYSVAKLC